MRVNRKRNLKSFNGLKEAEERNRLLLLENKQLRKALEMKSNDLEAMKKNEQRTDQDTAANVLHAVFTPG